MRYYIPAILLVLVLGVSPPLYGKEREVPKTMNSRVDMCLLCHKEAPEKVHGRKIVRCSECHLGNSLSSNVFYAHKGMVKNPGELKFVNRTCGRPGCHEKQVSWVKHTLMATNRGIISTLMYYWKEAPNQYGNLTIPDIMRMKRKTPSLDYISKLCGTCHLWLERGRYKGFLSEKGGGCSACHLVKAKGKGQSQKAHPRLVRAIPIENCVRCHNRSGRIGLSYQGKYESEGYGTPFKNGDFTTNELEDGRYFKKLPPDIHFKNGLLCVDCHTQKETMGDGKERVHMEEQLEVHCVDCHDPNSFDAAKKKGLAVKQNGKGGWIFVRKRDKVQLSLSMLKEGVCRDRDHRRLSCQACHSTWVPQCYGCHAVRRSDKSQTDWLEGRRRPGMWREYRSFMRYETPPLGVYTGKNGRQEVRVIVPGCQDFVTFLGEGDSVRGYFRRLTISWMDPHTTQKVSRSCDDCHKDPRALGLGEGNLSLGKRGWVFRPAEASQPRALGIGHPLSQFVTISGRSLVCVSRRGHLRPFNGKELDQILTVGICLDCHRGSSFPGYRPISYKAIGAIPCPGLKKNKNIPGFSPH